MRFDFERVAPVEFAFIDGGHDLEHVLNDSRKVYDVLSPGGWLVWHDFKSPVAWVKVREAIEMIGFVGAGRSRRRDGGGVSEEGAPGPGQRTPVGGSLRELRQDRNPRVRPRLVLGRGISRGSIHWRGESGDLFAR